MHTSVNPLFNKFELAGRNFEGIPTYANEVRPLHARVTLMQTYCRCSVVVPLIGMIALGGAGATLIVLSGGPKNLAHFAIGTGLSAFAVGFMLWLVIAAIRATWEKNEKEVTKRERMLETVTFQQALNDLVAETTTRQHVENVARGLPSQRQELLISTVAEHWAKANLPAYTNDHQKVLNGLAVAAPEALLAQIQRQHRTFALTLLREMDRTVLTQRLLDDIFAKIGHPMTPEEGCLLAKYPDAVRKYYNNFQDRLYAFAILKYANADQNVDLMKELMSIPRSNEEAITLARHPSLSQKMSASENRDAWIKAFLTYLPADHDPALLDTLLTHYQPTSPETAQNLARHPQALCRKVANNLDYAFAFLTHHELDAQGLQTIAVPADASAYQRFAAHPVALACLARIDTRFTPQLLTSIFDHMNHTQQALYLQSMADEYNQIPTAQLGIRKRFENAVKPLIAKVVNTELLGMLGSDQSSDQLAELIKQLCRWPKFLAECFYGDLKNNPLRSAHDLVTALVFYMQDDVRTTFETEAVQCLNAQKQEAAQLYAAWARVVGVVWPRWLSNIMAQIPEVVAAASTGQADMPPIVQCMSAEQRQQVTPTQVKAYRAATGLGQVKEKLKPKLRNLTQEENMAYLVTYFTTVPEDFKSVVMSNDQIGKQAERTQIALNLLEKMGVHAEAVINTIEKGSKGYPYFNLLTNTLMEEAKANATILTPSRKRLMARFAFAPDEDNPAKKKIDTTRDIRVFAQQDYWSLNPPGNDWDAFNTVTATLGGSVWQRR
jgi:hypothetical protein